MTLAEFAEKLNGRENTYPLFTTEEIQMAKDNGFVIVYGASDDLMEFEGVIRDEGDCYEGGPVYFTKDRVIFEELPNYDHANCIMARWCKDKNENGIIISWTYETDIPHETFMVYEDGEPYCRGIVFSVNNLK